MFSRFIPFATCGRIFFFKGWEPSILLVHSSADTCLSWHHHLGCCDNCWNKHWRADIFNALTFLCVILDSSSSFLWGIRKPIVVKNFYWSMTSFSYEKHLYLPPVIPFGWSNNLLCNEACRWLPLSNWGLDLWASELNVWAQHDLLFLTSPACWCSLGSKVEIPNELTLSAPGCLELFPGSVQQPHSGCLCHLCD